MTCTLDKPTIKDCINCPYPECVRSESRDNLVYIKSWAERNPEKYREYNIRKRKKYYEAHKEAENQRKIEWNQKHPKRAKAINRKAGRKYRKLHRVEERERNRLNYQKKKAERVS